MSSTRKTPERPVYNWPEAAAAAEVAAEEAARPTPAAVLPLFTPAAVLPLSTTVAAEAVTAVTAATDAESSSQAAEAADVGGAAGEAVTAGYGQPGGAGFGLAN